MNRTDHHRTPIKCVLQTSDRRHVVTASVLPFKSWPEVMIWGSRIFIKTDRRTKVAGDMVPIYAEGFPWTVLHTDELGDVFPTVVGVLPGADHTEDCAWTKADCEYKATHHYCPHPEHACDCKGKASDLGPITLEPQ